MKVYRITDWELHYEVNSDGGAWKPGQQKRKGPLKYYRAHVFGPAGDNQAYIEVGEIANEIEKDCWSSVWGIFCKLCEIAARQTDDYRGYLLGRGLSPISPESPRWLMRAGGFTETQVMRAFRVLMDPRIGWVEAVDCAVDSRGSPIPPKSPLLQEKQKQNKAEQNKTEQKLGGNSELAEPEHPTNFSSPTDSVSDSKAQQLRNLEGVDGVVEIIRLKLDYTPRRKLRSQANADETCFKIMGHHICRGDLGDVATAKERCFEAAVEFSTKYGNPVSQYLTWFKKELAKHDHEWDD